MNINFKINQTLDDIKKGLPNEEPSILVFSCSLLVLIFEFGIGGKNFFIVSTCFPAFYKESSESL